MIRCILDTDHITLYQRGHPAVCGRVEAIPAAQLAVTIISFEEQVRGRLAQVRRTRDGAAAVRAYQRLHETLDYFAQVRVLDFDEAAANQLHRLRKQRIRIGPQDLRIAAIALATDCMLVSRNQRDFSRIPGLVVEDWSQEA